MSLTRERCFNHPAREAAARCPECGRSFCRECVSEHAGRVICANCLRDIAGLTPHRTRSGIASGMIAIIMGLLITWSSFFLMGKALIHIPAVFHDFSRVMQQAGSFK